MHGVTMAELQPPVMLMRSFWIHSRFLGGKHPSVMLALDRPSQHMTSPALPSPPAFIWRECKENCATALA